MAPRRRYFHGGARGFAAGEVLLPPVETGASGAFARQFEVHARYRETPFGRHYRDDRVYMVTVPAAAAIYAGMAPGCDNRRHDAPGGCGCSPDPWSKWAGDVYEVEPIGELEREGPGVRWPAFARARSARIVGLYELNVARHWLDLPIDPAAPWYHGGTPGLHAGDELLPADATGLSNGIDDADSPDVAGRVFMTQRLETARWFAAHHPFGDHAQGGDVYVVETLAPLQPDPMLTRLDGICVCSSRVRITAVHTRAVARIGHENNPAWIRRSNTIRARAGLTLLPYPKSGMYR